MVGLIVPGMSERELRVHILFTVVMFLYFHSFARLCLLGLFDLGVTHIICYRSHTVILECSAFELVSHCRL